MADEQQPDVHPDVLYTRELPGGGFVTIEGQPVPDGIPFHGALTVERRSDPERRSGHVPPVVLEADGATPDEVLDRLVEVANNNVAVATALLKWQASRAAGDGEGTPPA
jgi:hypothetical protein